MIDDGLKIMTVDYPICPPKVARYLAAAINDVLVILKLQHFATFLVNSAEGLGICLYGSRNKHHV